MRGEKAKWEDCKKESKICNVERVRGKEERSQGGNSKR
jgi:hypothetical protein